MKIRLIVEHEVSDGEMLPILDVGTEVEVWLKEWDVPLPAGEKMPIWEIVAREDLR